MDANRLLKLGKAKSASATATSVTVTLAAEAGKRHVIYGYSGSALAQTALVELRFASTVKQSKQGISGDSVGDMFPIGIPAAVAEAVTVVTTNTSALCKANIIYETVVA